MNMKANGCTSARSPWAWSNICVNTGTLAGSPICSDVGAVVAGVVVTCGAIAFLSIGGRRRGRGHGTVVHLGVRSSRCPAGNGQHKRGGHRAVHVAAVRAPQPTKTQGARAHPAQRLGATVSGTVPCLWPALLMRRTQLAIARANQGGTATNDGGQVHMRARNTQGMVPGAAHLVRRCPARRSPRRTEPRRARRRPRAKGPCPFQARRPCPCTTHRPRRRARL